MEQTERTLSYLECSGQAVDHLVGLNVTVCVYVQSVSSLSQGTDCPACQDLFLLLEGI